MNEMVSVRWNARRPGNTHAQQKRACRAARAANVTETTTSLPTIGQPTFQPAVIRLPSAPPAMSANAPLAGRSYAVAIVDQLVPSARTPPSRSTMGALHRAPNDPLLAYSVHRLEADAHHQLRRSESHSAEVGGALQRRPDGLPKPCSASSSCSQSTQLATQPAPQLLIEEVSVASVALHARAVGCTHVLYVHTTGCTYALRRPCELPRGMGFVLRCSCLRMGCCLILSLRPPPVDGPNAIALYHRVRVVSPGPGLNRRSHRPTAACSRGGYRQTADFLWSIPSYRHAARQVWWHAGGAVA